MHHFVAGISEDSIQNNSWEHLIILGGITFGFI